MQTINDVWDKFATQEELAQAYLEQQTMFDELNTIIDDFFNAYELFKERMKTKNE